MSDALWKIRWSTCCINCFCRIIFRFLNCFFEMYIFKIYINVQLNVNAHKKHNYGYYCPLFAGEYCPVVLNICRNSPNHRYSSYRERGYNLTHSHLFLLNNVNKSLTAKQSKLAVLRLRCEP